MRLAQLFVTWFCVWWCIVVSSARFAVTLRYVTNQQEKLILCISLSIQCQKRCFIIFQGSWQPDTSILSILPQSASVSMIILKTWATLREVPQPIPNKAMWEKFSTVSALCGVCADGKHVTLQALVSPGSSHIYLQKDSLVLLVVMDALCNFVIVDISVYGRQSDGTVSARSFFKP